MNSKIARFAVVAAFTVPVLAAYASVPQSAAAASGNNHPDFAWASTAKPQGSRLFVGNLTLEDGGATAQYNPKELGVEQSVPWK